MQKTKFRLYAFLSALTAAVLTGCGISSQAGNQTPALPTKPILTEPILAEPILKESTASETPPASSADRLSTKVHILDVGQGLSILVESDGHYLLYDGGDSSASSFVVSYLKQQGVSSLDYVIASHYDSDHLNGVVGALHVFDTGEILSPDYETDTRVFRSFVNIAEEKNIPRTAPAVGTVYSLGNAKFQILAPSGTNYKDVNNYSVAVKLWDGEQSFLITGDMESQSEKEMLATGLDLDCDVYVLGHHGSASSTTWDLLQAATPEAAVLSCGAGNSYGHPHEETMEKLEAMEIDLYRTDKQGTLVADLKDSGISWNVKPCSDYTPGGEEISDPPATEKPVSPSTESPEASMDSAAVESGFVLNTSSKKIHLPSCPGVAKMSEKNKKETDQSLNNLLSQGYEPCRICMP